MSEAPRIRVAALLTLADRVVLVRHRAGLATYHLLPGGGVGYRETLEQALQREVREETGLDIRVGRPLFLSDTIDPDGPRHVVNITFAAEVAGGEITAHPADARVIAVDLVEPDRLGSLDLRPPMANEIVDVLARGSAPELQYLGSRFTQGRSSRTGSPP